MIDKIESFIKEIKKQWEALKISIDDAKRDDYEYNMFELNNLLWDYEFEYEKEQQELDTLYDKKFVEFRPNFKSDKACEVATGQFLQDKLIGVSTKKSMVKKYNRIHRWCLRLWDYMTWQIIQSNFNKKQIWF